jgi:hypothetical protein
MKRAIAAAGQQEREVDSRGGSLAFFLYHLCFLRFKDGFDFRFGDELCHLPRYIQLEHKRPGKGEQGFQTSRSVESGADTAWMLAVDTANGINVSLERILMNEHPSRVQKKSIPGRLQAIGNRNTRCVRATSRGLAVKSGRLFWLGPCPMSLQCTDKQHMTAAEF